MWYWHLYTVLVLIEISETYGESATRSNNVPETTKEDMLIIFLRLCTYFLSYDVYKHIVRQIVSSFQIQYSYSQDKSKLIIVLYRK